MLFLVRHRVRADAACPPGFTSALQALRDSVDVVLDVTYGFCEGQKPGA